jgi:hypothetical protein
MLARSGLIISWSDVQVDSSLQREVAGQKSDSLKSAHHSGVRRNREARKAPQVPDY